MTLGNSSAMASYVADHPAIMGHEFAGDIVKVGKNHQDKFKPGMKFTLQPVGQCSKSHRAGACHNCQLAALFDSHFVGVDDFGGDCTYCILPAEVMELNCLFEYTGRAYYEASLAEPMSCSIGATGSA